MAAIISGDSNSPSLITAVFRSGSTRCWADPTVEVSFNDARLISGSHSCELAGMMPHALTTDSKAKKNVSHDPLLPARSSQQSVAATVPLTRNTASPSTGGMVWPGTQDVSAAFAARDIAFRSARVSLRPHRILPGSPKASVMRFAPDHAARSPSPVCGLCGLQQASYNW